MEQNGLELPLYNAPMADVGGMLFSMLQQLINISPVGRNAKLGSI